MEAVISPAKVRRALYILTGDHRVFRLDRPGLKKIYRTRAKILHPDVAGGDGGSFASVVQAFEFLDELLAQDPRSLEKIIPPEPGRSPEVRSGYPSSVPRNFSRNNTPPPGEGQGRGPLPTRPLRFGQYLYYRGIISLDTLIQSLVWQHRRRPTFGRLAQDYDFLSSQTLGIILRQRHGGEKIGEAAVRLGYLDSYQKLVVLGSQRLYRAEVGQYFVEEGVLSSWELERELAAHRNHNLKFRTGGLR